MPATCTFLIHQFCLLLLVGLHLFVGSFPLASPSSSSSPPSSSSSTTDRSRFATTGPRGSTPPQEDSSFSAAYLLLPRAKESPEPSVASVGAGDLAIMSSESSNIETRTSSSHAHSTDAFSALGSVKGRTLWMITDSASVSTARTRNSAYIEMIRSGDTAQKSSSVMQARRADASPSSLDIARFETGTLRIHSPRTPVSSLSEDNHPITGSSHHIDRRWDADSTTSSLHIISMGSSTTANRGTERTTQFLTDSVAPTDSSRKDPVSQREVTTFPDRTQFPSHATHSRGRSNTSKVTHFPDSSARIQLAQYYLPPKTTAEDSSQSRSSSNTERSIPSSHTDGVSASGLSDRGGERTLQTLRDVSSSLNATQISPATSNEISTSSGLMVSSHVLTPVQTGQMDSSPEDNDFTEAALPHFQAPSETTAAENSGQLRSSSNTERSTSSSHTDGASASGLTDRGRERTSRTLRDVSSSLNATQLSTMASNEISTSSGLTNSSHMLTPVQTGQMDLSPGDNDFTEVTLAHSQASLGISATEDLDHQPASSSDTERSISSSHTDSASVSVLPDRGGERAVQTLRNNSISQSTTQKSTASNTEISSSSALPNSSYTLTLGQTRRMNLSTEDTDFIEAAVTHSQYPSEATDVRISQHTFNNFGAEERVSQTESMFSTATFIKSGDGTLGSLTIKSKSTDATELSTFDLENVSSLDLTLNSSTSAQSGKESFPSTQMDFSTGSSLQPVKVSDVERRLSGASTDSIYLSTAFMHGRERTSRSLPDNSTSPDATDSTTYNTETSESSDLTLSLNSGDETHNVSQSEVQSAGSFTEHLLQHSSEVPMSPSSPKDPSILESSQHSMSDASISHTYTESTYHSATFSKGEAQTLQSIVNNTFAEATERTFSYIEESNASELNPSSPEAYSRRTDFSVKGFDTPGPSTESFQNLSSSRIPTYSSFQSEPSDTGTDYQPMSSTDTGKIISVSHTDSTYISTTFTRGGERTLLSIPKSSTSADSSESSTFYAEISSPSESARSSFSVTQIRGSNMSSGNMGFSSPSTEPLSVHALKTPAYSSTVSELHATQLYSKSELTPAGSLSFTPSSSASLKQDSLPPTQLPTLFSTSESPLPLSSSAFPSLLSPSPQTLLPTLLRRQSPTAMPTLPPSSSLLPPLSSTPSLLQPSEPLESSVSVVASEGTTGTDPPTAGSSNRPFSNQTETYPLKDSTDLGTTGSSLILTQTTELLTDHLSPMTVSLDETKGSEGQNVSLPGTRVGKMPPVSTMSPTYRAESTTVSETAKATTALLPFTTTLEDAFSLVGVTTGKNLVNIAHTKLGSPTSASSMDDVVTTKPQKVLPPLPTKIPSYATGTPTKGMETSTTTASKTTDSKTTTAHPPKMFPSSKTTAGTISASPVPTKATTFAWVGSPRTFPASHGKANACTAETCLNNGKCIVDNLMGKFQCQCSPGWQGEDCSTDVDECLSNPCPALATCTNTQGSFHCTCSLGYQMEKGKCNLVRTFVGQFNTTGGQYSEFQVEEAIMNMLNNSLSTLPGYYTSTVKASRQTGIMQVSVLSTFSLVSNVTLFEVASTVRSHIRACKAPTQTCQFISKLTLLHRVGGLCKHKDPECDKETSVCVDLDGIAVCKCQAGYFKYNKLDHSCRACEDGYKLVNDTCVSCPFGLGGFNCGNPYQLITIVIAAAGGGLLLIMAIALIVTCCQKNKNDISKLIFKSGDFQMSPYAEYPKNPRAQDWGRETIEMQENGSTKNLLQMTDVYYMTTNPRNPELERNGLYPPYTGLPGSRHSCIYPGQYNPSFVSDDSRRRDYF
ncbi:protein HEG homolog 1 isoform X2 [Zootoca vivipara]|uniref:protein HEG homolog 1 isoform X2 n=1 Tax=Zootoca vivipara TaxID=8524 RepID=UPI0015927DE2|nr:protein HEG homolog 1 isoform X2 [Zootoca vivipara]